MTLLEGLGVSFSQISSTFFTQKPGFDKRRNRSRKRISGGLSDKLRPAVAIVSGRTT